MGEGIMKLNKDTGWISANGELINVLNANKIKKNNQFRSVELHFGSIVQHVYCEENLDKCFAEISLLCGHTVHAKKATKKVVAKKSVKRDKQA